MPSLLENLLVTMQENITIAQNKISTDIKLFYHNFYTILKGLWRFGDNSFNSPIL